MLHKHDKTFKRLAGCWKRAERVAKRGVADVTHPLYVPWANCLMMLNASDNTAEDLTHDIVLLDWFASKVEDFSAHSMIDGDDTLAAILYEWKERMFFNPVGISHA